MKISRLAGVAALLTAGFAQAQAPVIKMDGVLLEFWETQMMDNNLRWNTVNKTAGGATNYYDGLSSGRFQENTFAVKRSEIYMSGTITDTVSWNVMFDPNNNITATSPSNVLQDLVITWGTAKGFSLKAGQFKMPTTYEATLVAAREILFFDRNQLNRVFGDKRDRGIWAAYAYGDAQGFQGKVNVAISNGTTDDGSAGKTAADLNSQKDWMFRFEGGLGSAHKFGAYYREGEMSGKDSALSFTVPATWTVNPPSAQQVKDNKDKSTLLGAYYAFKNNTWQFSAEYGTGLLGRRFPTLGTLSREHLDQKFTGYAVDGAYKMGNHWITARYDMLNFNSGNDWYTATNPYTTNVATGVPTGADYTPKYTEITVGYNYVFVPSKQSMGKLKIDYIMRSKNFLQPLASSGQTSEQGGNSLVASLMVGF